MSNSMYHLKEYIQTLDFDFIDDLFVNNFIDLNQHLELIESIGFTESDYNGIIDVSKIQDLLNQILSTKSKKDCLIHRITNDLRYRTHDEKYDDIMDYVTGINEAELFDSINDVSGSFSLHDMTTLYMSGIDVILEDYTTLDVSSFYLSRLRNKESEIRNMANFYLSVQDIENIFNSTNYDTSIYHIALNDLDKNEFGGYRRASMSLRKLAVENNIFVNEMDQITDYIKNSMSDECMILKSKYMCTLVVPEKCMSRFQLIKPVIYNILNGRSENRYKLFYPPTEMLSFDMFRYHTFTFMNITFDGGIKHEKDSINDTNDGMIDIKKEHQMFINSLPIIEIN